MDKGRNKERCGGGHGGCHEGLWERVGQEVKKQASRQWWQQCTGLEAELRVGKWRFKSEEAWRGGGWVRSVMLLWAYSLPEIVLEIIHG